MCSVYLKEVQLDPSNYLSPDELLVLCNEVRSAGGADPLSELLPGARCVSDTCLIAKNLNFNCHIREDIYFETKWDAANFGYAYSDWLMLVGPNHKLAKNISKLIGWKLVYINQYEYALLLPEKVSESAVAFDLYEYPQELYLDRKIG